MPKAVQKISVSCRNCKTGFLAYPSFVVAGKSQFCSQECHYAFARGKLRPNRDVEAQFWKLVEKTDTCWIYRGTIDHYGYGVINILHKQVKAHRYAYELQIGPIPEGHDVLHHCDNPPCVRGVHLFTGTQADNNADSQSKGRHYVPSGMKGEQHPMAKVTEVQVLAMRSRYALGGVLQKELAAEYGISKYQASQILLRKTWRHL